MKYYYTYNCPDIAGWWLDMEFAYKDIVTGEIVWMRRFPEW